MKSFPLRTQETRKNRDQACTMTMDIYRKHKSLLFALTIEGEMEEREREREKRERIST